VFNHTYYKVYGDPNMSTRYKRFDCIFAVEGPYEPDMLHRMLTARPPATSDPQVGGAPPADPRYRVVGGPYQGIPGNHVVGDIVLLTRSTLPICVFNGQAHKTQRLLNVYRQNGTVTKADIERWRSNGDQIVDFMGSITIRYDRHGHSIERKIAGTLKPEIRDGEAIFVRDAQSGEGLETAFLVDSLGGTGQHVLRRPLIAKIDTPRSLAVFKSLDLRTMQWNHDEQPRAVNVPIDPTTGEPMDAITPDGNIHFTIGPREHVVLAIGALGQVWKGTKADMLERENGKLDLLGRLMPEKADVLEQIRTAIETFDPSTEVLLVNVPSNGNEPQIQALPVPE
jgi:hypothetical protein